MKTFTIGKVAAQVGVNVETIRFYERKGLIPRPPDNQSGYRRYSSRVIERIYFIRRAQRLGFSLKEISDILGLLDIRQADCQNVAHTFDRKITEIENKIQLLLEIKQRLVHFKDKCLEMGEECLIHDSDQWDVLSL